MMPIKDGADLIRSYKFNVGGVDYFGYRMKPLAVIGVARRIAPMLTAFKDALAAVPPPVPAPSSSVRGEGAQDAEAGPAGSPLALQIGRFAPVLDALARLPDEDQNYVIGACIGVVQTQGIVRLWYKEDNRPADHLTAGDVLGITGNVLGRILSDLFDELGGLGLPGLDAVQAKA